MSNYRETATLRCDECDLTWDSAGGDLQTECKEYKQFGTDGMHCKANEDRGGGGEEMSKTTLTDGMLEREIRHVGNMLGLPYLKITGPKTVSWPEGVRVKVECLDKYVTISFTPDDLATLSLDDVSERIIVPLINYLKQQVQPIRPQLLDFSFQMEAKLRKNDHKNALGWHKQPIEALVRLMALEFEEFKVSDEFYPVERAREELVDIANFALILHDRLGILQQDRTRHEQDNK